MKKFMESVVSLLEMAIMAMIWAGGSLWKSVSGKEKK